MKIGLLKFALLLTVISLQGCSEYYYMPNRQNVLPLKKKNDLQLTGTISQNISELSNLSVFEIQSAYAPTNHIGVIANYFYLNSLANPGKANFMEIGGGYYSLRNADEGGFFSVYGGMGYSKLSSWGYKMNLTRGFILPSFGYTSSQIDFIVSARFCGVQYSDIRDQKTIIHYPNDSRSPLSNYTYGLIEPAITFGAGSRNVKVNAQYVYSFTFNDPNQKLGRSLGMLHGNINVSASLNITGFINRIKDKKTEH